MAKNPNSPEDIDESPSIMDRLGRWLSTKRQTMNEEQEKTDVATTEVTQTEVNTDTTKNEGEAQPQRSKTSGAARRRRRTIAAKRKATESTEENKESEDTQTEPENENQPPVKKSRPRGRRGRGGRGKTQNATQPDSTDETVADVVAAETTTPPQTEQAPAEDNQASEKKSSSRGRRNRGGRSKSQTTQSNAPGDEIEETETAASAANRKLLINSEEPEECRVVLLENGKVESFHIETMVHAQQKGNIYKGKIAAVEPNLQAAFVEIGTGKNGFLPFSDIHPEYYSKEVDPNTHWKDLNIQDVVRKGTEVLVEVVKEATGNKGANMTTFLSLPGRYLVLMPGSDSAGISRKISNEEQRRRLRDTMESLKIPEGVGYIVRTASNEITKTALSQDLKYLLNLWAEIKARGQNNSAPSLAYKEQNV
ncbi:MAG: ribonuclease E/G, partial [Desulfobulbaceae bacterium]|nr:ribonuclease E/G [Desulfobulbaceae bacterium]